MSNRIDLSTDTFIETMNGVRYLVTTRGEVSAAWISSRGYAYLTEGDERDDIWVERRDQDNEDCQVVWRIPLTAVAPVYEYREGEPGVQGWPEYYMDTVVWVVELFSDDDVAELDEGFTFHRRAAVVADTGEQFLELFEELKEARGQ